MTRRRPEASAAPLSGASAPDAPATDRAAHDRRDRRDRRIVLAVVLWIPLAIIAAGTGILIAWLPRTPDPLVTHWGADGEADGWMPPVANLLTYLGISLGVLAIMAVSAWVSRRPATRTADASPSRPGSGPSAAGAPSPAAATRPAAVFSPGVTLALAVVFVSLTGLQLDGGVPDGWEVAVVVVIALGLAVLAGVATWIVLPAPEAGDDDGEAVAIALRAAIRLAPGERAVWTSVVRAPWPVTALAVLALVLALVPVVLAPSAWLFSLGAVLVIGVLATTTAARVAIDGSGLTVRTLLGLPIGRVRLADAVVARAVDVRPAEFGGWGFRFDARGRRGVILRGGTAIEVERRGAGPFVVTVPDAETGAALLNGLIARG
ncbi:DUF1648 domain-containing protein [Agromyces intestinalis]|uniref:DUF1648 domain-containing protein n=1 Tax=Agromyces intestinalis TaxID=2592652 RepID=A0A5C1YFG5_9MICO|nr:DUF1648 domain-containing protein [Agromyces intestinalis]QEO13739.1 DUF1648 domain-containing protein [Agromyces intestinalis]